MKILVKNNNYVLRIDCNSMTSVYTIKTEIVRLTTTSINGLKIDDIILYKSGQVLEDGEPLLSYKIKNGDILSLCFRMRGGDIFGSNSNNFSSIWYFLGAFFLILCPFFISGVIPIIGHIYGAAVAGIVRRLGRKFILAWNEAKEIVEKVEEKQLESIGEESSADLNMIHKTEMVGGVGEVGVGEVGENNKRNKKRHSAFKIGSSMLTSAVSASGLGHSATQFIDNVMNTQTKDDLSNKQLVCTLADFTRDFDAADLLNNPIISECYNRTFAISQKSGDVATTSRENTVAYIKFLQAKILSSGDITKDCLVGYPTFKKIVGAVAWIFKIGGMVILTWIITYMMISPLSYAYTDIKSAGLPSTNCTAITLTKWITLTLVLVFVGIYVLTGIPFTVRNLAEDVVGKLPNMGKTVLEVTAMPVVNLFARIGNVVKVGFFNFITFGWIGVFEVAVHFGLESLYLGLAEASRFSCDNPSQLDSLSEQLSTMVSQPEYQMVLGDNKLLKSANLFISALSEKRLAELKDTNMMKYIMAKMIRFVFCQGLKLSAWIFRMFKGMGGELMMEDMIVNGGISGIAYTIAFLVIFIMFIFGANMFGITYSS